MQNSITDRCCSALRTAILSLAGFAFIHSVSSYELLDDRLELYAMLHPSIDLMDSNVSLSEAEASTSDKLATHSVSLSFNASRMGIRGSTATEFPGLTAFFQLEQSIMAKGGDSDELTSRNSFVGLRGVAYVGEMHDRYHWEVLAGRYDSLFKRVALEYSLMKHTVADRGAILGAGAYQGNMLDKRVENTLLGRWHSTTGPGKWRAQLQYSPDAVASNGQVDNNKRMYLGLASDWQYRNYSLAFGYDFWQALISTDSNGNTIAGDALLWRMAGRYRTERLTLTGVFESTRYAIDRARNSDLNRKAMAFQMAYRLPRDSWFGGWRLLTSVMAVTDYKGLDNSGATKVALGLDTQLNRNAKWYWLGTQTRNDDNASFQGVDGTHGDELGTLNGNHPYALSTGMEISF